MDKDIKKIVEKQMKKYHKPMEVVDYDVLEEGQIGISIVIMFAVLTASLYTFIPLM